MRCVTWARNLIRNMMGICTERDARPNGPWRRQLSRGKPGTGSLDVVYGTAVLREAFILLGFQNYVFKFDHNMHRGLHSDSMSHSGRCSYQHCKPAKFVGFLLGTPFSNSLFCFCPCEFTLSYFSTFQFISLSTPFLLCCILLWFSNALFTDVEGSQGLIGRLFLFLWVIIWYSWWKSKEEWNCCNETRWGSTFPVVTL